MCDNDPGHEIVPLRTVRCATRRAALDLADRLSVDGYRTAMLDETAIETDADENTVAALSRPGLTATEILYREKH